MAEEDTGERDPNELLYALKYDLDSSMVEEAASLLGGSSTKNPAYLASGCLLLLIIFMLTVPDPNTPLAVAIAVVAAALWAVGAKWRNVQLRHLHKCGFDPVLATKEHNHHEVELYEAVLVERTGDGDRKELPIGALKKVLSSERLCVLKFAGDTLVLIPRSAMSFGNYNALVTRLSPKKKAK